MMKITLPENLIVFDTETTSIDLAESGVPEIVEIAGVKVNRIFEAQGTFTQLVCPRRLDHFDEVCQELTGIGRAEIEAAPMWPDVWREWADFTHFNGYRLASFGSGFDWPVLRAQYLRYRLGFPHKYPELDVRSIIWTWGADLGMKWGNYSLAALKKRLGMNGWPAHRALDDSMATVEAMRRVAAMFDD